MTLNIGANGMQIRDLIAYSRSSHGLTNKLDLIHFETHSNLLAKN